MQGSSEELFLGALGVHDLGGVAEAFGPIKLDEPTLTSHWQSRVDALAALLFKRKIVGVDEFRRFIEQLPGNSYTAVRRGVFFFFLLWFFFFFFFFNRSCITMANGRLLFCRSCCAKVC
jgi:membrane associated rhomboid family serine protease